jgi:hypothetical protein
MVGSAGGRDEAGRLVDGAACFHAETSSPRMYKKAPSAPFVDSIDHSPPLTSLELPLLTHSHLLYLLPYYTYNHRHRGSDFPSKAIPHPHTSETHCLLTKQHPLRSRPSHYTRTKHSPSSTEIHFITTTCVKPPRSSYLTCPPPPTIYQRPSLPISPDFLQFAKTPRYFA